MNAVRCTFLFVGAVSAGAALAAIGCSSSDPVVDAGSDAALPVDASVDADAATLCAQLGSLCHPYDLGPGVAHDCHELGHDGDEAVCAAQKDACLAACTASEGARLPITLRFEAAMGDAPFACGQSYADVGAEGSTVTPIDFRMYVQDVVVFDEAGKPVPVALEKNDWQNESVALLDFEDGTGACKNGTSATNTAIRGTVPFGKYKGVGFTVGVPQEMNHLAVDQAPSPANLSSMYWSWMSGHVFLARACAPRRWATPASATLAMPEMQA